MIPELILVYGVVWLVFIGLMLMMTGTLMVWGLISIGIFIALMVVIGIIRVIEGERL